MNHVIPRLKIIDLAITLEDKETLQLQILKLQIRDTTPKIREIIALVQEERYQESRSSIATYIQDNSPEEKETTTNQPPKIIEENERLRLEEEQQIIDEFQLFVKPKKADKNQKHATNAPIDYASLLNLDKEDIHTDDFFVPEEISQTPLKEKPIIPIDTFFETVEKSQEIMPILPQPKKERDLKEIKISKITNQTYPPISYIGTKLVDMKKLYPSEYYTEEIFFSVDALTSKICDDGYTEKEIEETLFYIKKLIGQKAYKEASQLVLVCGATESKFAHLMLARELYKGLLFKQDVNESFIIINKLALEEHAEALCDLAQFYENGIGTKKDKKKAEKYYKESMNKGINRAKTHYERIKKENSSFFKK